VSNCIDEPVESNWWQLPHLKIFLIAFAYIFIQPKQPQSLAMSDWLLFRMREIVASIYIVDDPFVSRFFYYSKMFAFLLTFKNELHLVSIDNTVVNNKREQHKSVLDSVRTNERTNKKADHIFCFIIIIRFSFFLPSSTQL
jgi:hypothetical protein